MDEAFPSLCFVFGITILFGVSVGNRRKGVRTYMCMQCSQNTGTLDVQFDLRVNGFRCFLDALIMAASVVRSVIMLHTTETVLLLMRGLLEGVFFFSRFTTL